MAKHLGLGGNERKVMIAIDESECSHYALNWVLHNLQDSLSNSSLLIFTVRPLTGYSSIIAASYGFPHPELIRSVEERRERISLALLEKAKDICANQGVIAKTISEFGDPQETICEAVEKFNINLLILGSHGRGLLQRLVSFELLLSVQLTDSGFKGTLYSAHHP
ncbi:PREDICTED: uncharacterized protein LOC104602239 isoform X1 [Nelumbo nucifera]|uniref:Uncharacterized protein LOC104602239 isoform X1 n=1 Tax=Nelumbo nucifera TaxID=4432 RepID=A0A1U8Q588_NELNU|nr:PREDICTED: uncharacterized protein LOC104602239 isoform X1 [Nelumbo nucifera]